MPWLTLVMGMVTVRSGSWSRVTVTPTVPPSATVYVPCSKLTATDGTSSSVMVTVVSSGVPALTRASGMEPNPSLTLSPSSSIVSCVAEKVMLFSVSPLWKVTLSGTPE